MKIPYDKTKKWRNENPIKVRAYRIVYVAKRNGTLIPEKCFCGNRKTEAHHWDYFEPLSVNWYCKKHHVEADKIARELGLY